jgi:cell division protein FtsN
LWTLRRASLIWKDFYMKQHLDCRGLAWSLLLACGAALGQQPNLDELQRKIDDAKRAKQQRAKVASPPTATPNNQAPPNTAASSSTKPDPFSYFIQVGAYAKPEDAAQQRDRVSRMGMTAAVSEREQSGRIVYRVRLGPYERKEDADAVQERLAGVGVEAALVRIER